MQHKWTAFRKTRCLCCPRIPHLSNKYSKYDEINIYLPNVFCDGWYNFSLLCSFLYFLEHADFLKWKKNYLNIISHVQIAQWEGKRILFMQISLRFLFVVLGTYSFYRLNWLYFYWIMKASSEIHCRVSPCNVASCICALNLSYLGVEAGVASVKW